VFFVLAVVVIVVVVVVAVFYLTLEQSLDDLQNKILKNLI